MMYIVCKNGTKYHFLRCKDETTTANQTNSYLHISEWCSGFILNTNFDVKNSQINVSAVAEKEQKIFVNFLTFNQYQWVYSW